MRGLFLALAVAMFPVFAFAIASDYLPSTVGAGAPEVHINRDGMMQLKSARVDQLVGTTLFLTMKWGQMSMRFTMKTDSQTVVIKRYGGASTVAQIKVGDYIDADGEFFVGSDFFGLNARFVKDWSLQEESETFSGKISEINPDGAVVLQTGTGKSIFVRAATSTNIRKGAVVIPWGRLMKEDSVTFADGIYDYAKNTLTANQIIIVQSQTPFTPRNYEGELRQIDSVQAPTTFTINVNGTDYRVKVNEKTLIFKKNRSAAQLARFVVGDTVRFYGGLREEEKTLRDELIVDAEVVRNLNL